MTRLGDRIVNAGRPDFDEATFTFIGSLAQHEAGLMIPREKATMVFTRLNKRLKTLGIERYESYCELLRRGDPDALAERRALISILTTNVTSFMREPHHFEILRQDILPGLIARGRAGGRVRMWSAGCSSGQEPYTIGMCVLEDWPDVHRFDFRILASDIDEVVLQQAREGKYAKSTIETLPDKWRSSYFSAPDANGQCTVSKDLRKLITFRPLNLVKPWPFSGKFDVIFCRNVVIYFDQDTQNQLWPRFEEVCYPGATLFLGHSERVEDAAGTALQMIGKTAYRKPGSSPETVT